MGSAGVRQPPADNGRPRAHADGFDALSDSSSSKRRRARPGRRPSRILPRLLHGEPLEKRAGARLRPAVGREAAGGARTRAGHRARRSDAAHQAGPGAGVAARVSRAAADLRTAGVVPRGAAKQPARLCRCRLPYRRSRGRLAASGGDQRSWRHRDRCRIREVIFRQASRDAGRCAVGIDDRRSRAPLDAALRGFGSIRRIALLVAGMDLPGGRDRSSPSCCRRISGVTAASSRPSSGSGKRRDLSARSRAPRASTAAVGAGRLEARARPDGRTGCVQRALQAEVGIRQRAERSGDANRAKSAFLANMSHEIRTPLNAILGYARILLRRDRAGRVPARRRRRPSPAAPDHLLHLINEILDLSKIDAGRMEMTRAKFDLAGARSRDRRHVPAAVRGKHLTMCVDGLDGMVSPRVVGDAGKLRQVLINLLGNAVKFTETWPRHAAADRKRRRPWRFEVEDTGPGIPHEIRELHLRAVPSGLRRQRERRHGPRALDCQPSGGVDGWHARAGVQRGHRVAFCLHAASAVGLRLAHAGSRGRIEMCRPGVRVIGFGRWWSTMCSKTAKCCRRCSAWPAARRSWPKTASRPSKRFASSRLTSSSWTCGCPDVDGFETARRLSTELERASSSGRDVGIGSRWRAGALPGRGLRRVRGEAVPRGADLRLRGRPAGCDVRGRAAARSRQARRTPMTSRRWRFPRTSRPG